MSHPLYRVVSFEIIGPYMIRVQFNDQTEQVIDLSLFWLESYIVRYVTYLYLTGCE